MNIYIYRGITSRYRNWQINLKVCDINLKDLWEILRQLYSIHIIYFSKFLSDDIIKII